MPVYDRILAVRDVLPPTDGAEDFSAGAAVNNELHRIQLLRNEAVSVQSRRGHSIVRSGCCRHSYAECSFTETAVLDY